MRRVINEAEGWKRMVLQSMPRPAWLAEDAPHVDVVLSSRARTMRNLRGYRFPNKASDRELEEVMRAIHAAAEQTHLGLEVFRGLTNAERDYFVGCRLVSPDFPWTLPSRSLLVDPDRSLSLMVNEEDHLRLQALSAGWSIGGAGHLARHCLEALEVNLVFAHSPEFGHLSASPFNSGAGRRQSAMFHLIGLAQCKRLPQVLRALAVRGIVVRGLFGEASRAIGAFAQVSRLNGTDEEYVGACEYLIREEREARAQVGRDTLIEKAQQARDFAASSRMLSLADSLRILGWLRWAAWAEAPGVPLRARAVDEALALLELRAPMGEEQAARQRADHVRSALRL